MRGCVAVMPSLTNLTPLFERVASGDSQDESISLWIMSVADNSVSPIPSVWYTYLHLGDCQCIPYMEHMNPQMLLISSHMHMHRIHTDFRRSDSYCARPSKTPR